MIDVKIVVTRPYKFALNTVINGVVQACDEAAVELKATEDAVMANWDNKADVKVTKAVAANIYTWTIQPVGGNAKIWHWVSRGVPARTGWTRRAGGLFSFRTHWPKMKAKRVQSSTGYIAKTGPNYVFGRKSDRGKYKVAAALINWPGIKPRHFEEEIIKRYRPLFKAKVEAAFTQSMANFFGG